MKKSFCSWMLLASLTLGLASCSVDDTPISKVDDKPFTYDSEIDYSVNPGDNFYQYALGQWLKSSDPLPSIFKLIETEFTNLTDGMLANSSDPVLVALRSQAEETMSDDSKNKALLNERLQMLEQITTGDQLYEAFVTLQGLGYSPLFRAIPYVATGKKMINVIATGGTIDEMCRPFNRKQKDSVEYIVNSYCQYLSTMGFSDQRVAQIASNALKIELMEMDAYLYTYDLLRHPLKKHLTRGTDEENKNAVLKMMGYTNQDIADDKFDFWHDNMSGLLVKFALAGENQEDVKAFRDYMIYNVMLQDAQFVPSVNQKATVLGMIKSALRYNKYYMYRLNAENYGLSNICKQQCYDILERMRKTFIQRLEKLDWMTDATKAEARKKAEATKFYVGYPEKWNDQYTPSVNGDCMLASATQLRQNGVEMTKSLLKKNYDDAVWEVWASSLSFTTDNAFYTSEVNSLIILPAWITKPRFNNDLSDATLYAIATTFAHEFCHGFDSTGAEYDAVGNKSDWWTAVDRAAFKDKQQMLIKLYDQLEAYPGQMADGTKTLGENMADYGGMEITLECYKQLLTELGFKGKQYDEQLKKFFLSYAQVWKEESELSIDKLKRIYELDVHSASHNRVNGMMRLQDDWYRLYDVKPTDKLYLAPADRVKIW